MIYFGRFPDRAAMWHFLCALGLTPKLVFLVTNMTWGYFFIDIFMVCAYL